jgi:hypothetical protein
MHKVNRTIEIRENNNNCYSDFRYFRETPRQFKSPTNKCTISTMNNYESPIVKKFNKDLCTNCYNKELIKLKDDQLASQFQNDEKLPSDYNLRKNVIIIKLP